MKKPLINVFWIQRQCKENSLRVSGLNKDRDSRKSGGMGTPPLVEIGCHFTRKPLFILENTYAVFKVIVKKQIYIIVLLENQYLLPLLWIFPPMPQEMYADTKKLKHLQWFEGRGQFKYQSPKSGGQLKDLWSVQDVTLQHSHSAAHVWIQIKIS